MFPELLQAFFIPPNIYIVHRALNLTYQFWLHTTTVPYLGPLEYFLNTPSKPPSAPWQESLLHRQELWHHLNYLGQVRWFLHFD
ncbi:hypothetical protein COOONC_03783 [Cooperia oncophora]